MKKIKVFLARLVFKAVFIIMLLLQVGVIALIIWAIYKVIILLSRI